MKVTEFCDAQKYISLFLTQDVMFTDAKPSPIVTVTVTSHNLYFFTPMPSFVNTSYSMLRASCIVLHASWGRVMPAMW
jgi:hypothetical protein